MESSKPDKAEQIPTEETTVNKIMSRPSFLHGVRDVISGKPPRFDEMDDNVWAYERGRQYATLCKVQGRLIPRTILRDGSVNPKALAAFWMIIDSLI